MNQIRFFQMLSGALCIWAGALAAGNQTPSRDALDAPDGKGRTLRQILNSQRQDSLRSARAMKKEADAQEAFVNLVRVDADPASCLAFNRTSRECAVSDQEFNEQIPSFLPKDYSGNPIEPTAKSAPTIRKKIMDFLLDQAFTNDPGSPYAAKAGLSMDTQFGHNKLPEGITEKMIVDLYQENFVALVRFQNRMSFEVYASTDSGLIDSLKSSLSSGNAEPRWAPVTASAHDAPEEWILASGSLSPRDWSLPLKTSFGYAILRINRHHPTRNEILPILIQLAYSRMNALQTDWDRLGREYYREHIAAYRAKDTLELLVRLIPRPAQMRFRSTSISLGGEDSLLAAAAMGLPMRKATQFDLPPRLKLAVETRHEVDSIISGKPFYSDFGYWWIAPLKSKRGMGVLPYERVHAEILERLQAEKLANDLQDAEKTLASKQQNKTLNKARDAWVQSLAEEVQPEEIRELAGSDASQRTESKTAEAPEGDAEPVDENALRVRIAERKIAATKDQWIADNIELASDPH